MSTHRITRPWTFLCSREWIGSLVVSSTLWLAGCATGGDVTRPIPTADFPAPASVRRTVVMLPGRGDDLASMERRQVARTIQAAWPDADVVLTGLTMPFYRQGLATQRLHDEVIEPVRRRQHGPIWIAGISLGGMGALLYDHDYPGQIDGLLLFSPYLGDDPIHDEIRNAGGLASWNAGPPRTVGPDTFQHEMWRTLQQWSDRPDRTRTAWVAYGEDEAFRAPIELMTPQLAPDHVLMLPGQHDWALWTPAIGKLLARASSAAER